MSWFHMLKMHSSIKGAIFFMYKEYSTSTEKNQLTRSIYKTGHLQSFRLHRMAHLLEFLTALGFSTK
jgi:hypothetical protein